VTNTLTGEDQEEMMIISKEQYDNLTHFTNCLVFYSRIHKSHLDMYRSLLLRIGENSKDVSIMDSILKLTEKIPPDMETWCKRIASAQLRISVANRKPEFGEAPFFNGGKQ